MEPAEDDARRGLSASAWAAIATLGAAAITGGVTLLTHVLDTGNAAAPLAVSTQPEGSSQSGQRSLASARPTATATATAPRSAVIDAMVGTWRGPVTDGAIDGTITLRILPSCAVDQPCGTLETTLIGCVWDIELKAVRDGPQPRFATVRVVGGDPASCGLHPAGDDFLIAKDQLIYTTGYSGSVRGTLERVG